MQCGFVGAACAVFGRAPTSLLSIYHSLLELVDTNLPCMPLVQVYYVVEHCCNYGFRITMFHYNRHSGAKKNGEEALSPNGHLLSKCSRF